MDKEIYKEIEGNLITLAQEGHFDVIVHGCNIMNCMGGGIAPQMAKAFGDDNFPLEQKEHKGNINKLGCIDYQYYNEMSKHPVAIVNAYTQIQPGIPGIYGIPFDYDAFALCMRKINHIFKGKHIGLPQIGAGLAGGDWEMIKNCIIT